MNAPVLLEQAGAGTDGDQFVDSTAILLAVDSVMVADRYRKEIGDVSDLAKSIVDVGLLNPITVREWHGGYRLVAGERRLTAFRQLGLAEIPARVARDIADARDALVAERDENTARKPMLPSEATALGMAIEEMERPAAAQRRAANLPNGSRDPFGAEGAGRARDIAADAIGMGEATYRRIKTLVSLADDEDHEVREASRSAVAAIDSGAPVRSEYDRVAAVRSAVAADASVGKQKRANDHSGLLLELASEHPTVRIAFEQQEHYGSLDAFDRAARAAGASWRFTERQWQAHVGTSRDVLDRSTLAIEVAMEAIVGRVDFTTITPEQAGEALERLTRTALTTITRQLKEISNV